LHRGADLFSQHQLDQVGIMGVDKFCCGDIGCRQLGNATVQAQQTELPQPRRHDRSGRMLAQTDQRPLPNGIQIKR
jgi:hypothetical protein